jgi:hypothetical protein
LKRHAAILAVRKDHRCPRGARDQVSVPLVAPACGMSPGGEAASGPDGALGSVSAVPIARSVTGAVASKS